jgi:hypothetical protein
MKPYPRDNGIGSIDRCAECKRLHYPCMPYYFHRYRRSIFLCPPCVDPVHERYRRSYDQAPKRHTRPE